jgi:hypothetical protein
VLGELGPCGLALRALGSTHIKEFQCRRKGDRMKNVRLWNVTLCAGLFWVSTAQAAIVANLETPTATGAGKTVLSGFAYDDGGKTVTIRARIDGVTLTGPEVIVPSGTIRQDVTANVNSGFSLLFNFGTAFNPPGPHTIGVEITAPGETPKIVDRAIKVIHPGNAAFVDDFDLSGASCSLQGDTINLNNVRITPSGGGQAVTTNLGAQFAVSEQELVFVSDSSNPTPTTFTANLNGSQEVPTPTSLTATGTGTLELNRSNNTITSCSLTFSNLTGAATAAHIHLAPPGTAGDIIVPLNLGSGGTSPATCTSNTPLTADQVTALDQGNLYFNVHTTANPTGEGRGQIVAKP